MIPLGDSPSVLDGSDPNAVAMREDGYWVTDFHAVFTDRAVFRDGKWIELTTRVHDFGTLRVKPGWGLFAQDEDVEFDTMFDRLPPGDAQVSVATSDDRLLALLLRFDTAHVVGWTPALYDEQRMMRAPYLPVVKRKSERFFLSSGGIPTPRKVPDDLRFGARLLDDRVIALHVGGGDVRAWWGLDPRGAIAAFVLDVSGSLLREGQRRDPTKDDPRGVKNSCPRLVKDPGSLVRRIERLASEGQIELEQGVDVDAIARAFFAQPNGNLRAWLVDAPGIAEVFYSD